MKYFWVLLTVTFVFTGLAMYRFIHTGVPIEPTRVLDPTVFAAPEQIGAAMFRRYYPEFREGHVFIFVSSLGVQNYDRVWQGLLALGKEKGWGATEIFSQNGLRSISGGVDKIFKDYDVIVGKMNPAKTSQEKIVLQMVASAAEIEKMSKQLPEAVIIAEEPYSEEKFKKLDKQKLTAAAELGNDKVTYLYVSEPPTVPAPTK